ncbi:MAG: S8 family serine peptidase [Candidatus Eremiobacteraeota bacterium]|nr:S8 family serine peptidase [Candidatus Eremiobacteraeota bacterium]
MAAALFSSMVLPAAASAPDRAALYTLPLSGGRQALVYGNGLAKIVSKDRTGRDKVAVRTLPFFERREHAFSLTNGMPDKAALIHELSQEPQRLPYVDGRVIVVFRDGVAASNDSITIPTATLQAMRVARTPLGASAAIPPYTNDLSTNTLFAKLGVDQSDRLFRQFNRSALSAMRSTVQPAFGSSSLNIANAYRLHVTSSSVRHAVAALLRLPSVAYASPDWLVQTMQTQSIPLPRSTTEQAASRARMPSAHAIGNALLGTNSVPTNYAVSSSAQSLLNAPGVNAITAFDEIQSRFHQLPGQGEMITNVSLGDLVYNPKGPCSVFGFAEQTTHLIGGQMYIDWPSMPLIPAYTADASGNLSGSREECGQDSSLGEVGLDFSMMAPLPHKLQRPAEMGSGQTDLLGIAPGAAYRLIVPATSFPSFPSTTDIDAAFLAAAMQSPRPNVITASLGFGYDTVGFPSRYFEDDPLSEAIIAAIVHSYNIVVCISSGDGTRTYTNTSIGPSGGSVPTDRIASGETPTNLNDVAYSTVPSRDFDSGSIDVGGTTLDDIFAAPPQDPRFAALSAQHAFPETRWTGFTNFASGWGTRVNVSAPSDNVLALSYAGSGNFDNVAVNLAGGTSASAPETAAAAAVALQVARLTGHPLEHASDVRALLAETGTTVPRVSQSDATNFVGPQINLGHMVETLVHRFGRGLEPHVARVAIEQRRDVGGFDSDFLTDTDSDAINLQGPVSQVNGSNTDANERAWITIAPDWEDLPSSARFILNVDGRDAALAKTPWARLLPAQILTAAGLPLVSPSSRTVKLRYRAIEGAHLLAEATFSLTFGPADPTTEAILAPVVPAVVTGTTIPVQYDISGARMGGGQPRLVVSEPGHVDPDQYWYRPIYTTFLTGSKGTVEVPVSALQGGGIYGIAVAFGAVSGNHNLPLPLLSDFAFTRVASTTAGRPNAPLLSSDGSAPGHFLEIPYKGSFQVHYDVRNVPGANGAHLEISSPGQNLWYSSNPFNNPNGTVRDDNEHDTGSVYFEPLPGTAGTVTLGGLRAKLDPTFDEVVRVLPTDGGRPVGEASDVSTIMMDGIVPADGGSPNGWDINSNGTDGFLASAQFSAAGQTLSSVEIFDQASGAITHTAAAGTPNGDLFFPLGNGISGGDIGLFGDITNPAGYPFSYTYSILHPVSSGTVASAWNPPLPKGDFLLSVGVSPATSEAAIAVGIPLGAGGTNGYGVGVFASNLATNTFGPLYDLTAQQGCNNNSQCSEAASNVVEDPIRNTAIVGFGDAASVLPPHFAEVNLATGKTESFHGPIILPYEPIFQVLAVDPATNKLAVINDSGFDLVTDNLSVYDLATHQNRSIHVPGPANMCMTVDTKHHEILVSEFAPANLVEDNNALSVVLVYDENLRLLSGQEKFNYNGHQVTQSGCLQANPATRSDYTDDDRYTQIQPFTY